MDVKKAVIAIDSFKGSMSSAEACRRAAEGIKAAFPRAETVCIPVADGGEGTVEAYLSALGGERVEVEVTGPDFRPVKAFYGILPDKSTAVIEMAAASGLPLVLKRDAGGTTTYGTGELLAHAAARGCKSIILGLGGSATNDGGAGALSALGAKLLDADGRPIRPTGDGLARLADIDASGLDRTVAKCRVTLACDVDNPLCGPRGASHVFGPQKGAGPDDVLRLDENLMRFAGCVKRATGRDIASIPGGGAAGGIAAGLMGFLDARIQSGVRMFLKTIKFDEVLSGADIVVTGEGRVDAQSACGKVPSGVGAYAEKAGVPAIVVAGDIGEGYESILSCGIDAVFSINHLAVSFQKAKRRSASDMTDTVKNIALLLRAMGS